MANHLLNMAMGVHRGMYRETNEDAVAYQYPSDYDMLLLRGALVVLADGVAAQGGGAAASQMAVSYLSDAYYGQPITMSCKECLIEAIEKVNRDIYEAYRGSATTIVAAVIHERKLIVAHVGDSRAYRIRKQMIQQLTRDHVVTSQLPDGTNQTSLSRAVGNQARVDVDIDEIAINEGDTILLVSDGVTRYLKNHQLLQIARTRPTTAVRDIIHAANKAGGKDNIGVVVVQVAGEIESQYGYFLHLSEIQPQIIVTIPEDDVTAVDPVHHNAENRYFLDDVSSQELEEIYREDNKRADPNRVLQVTILIIAILGLIILIIYAVLTSI